MTRPSLRSPAASALGLAALMALVGPARDAAAADDEDALMQCASASNKGLDLRKQGKLTEARRVLAACAAPSCGAAISGVCQKRIADINAVMPTIVFLPKDGAGKDILGVKMTIDGQEPGVVLDGRPVALDPGPHVFKFEVQFNVEVQGSEPVTRSLIVAEGAKSRQEPIEMSPPPAARRAAAAATEPDAPAPHSGQRTAGLWVGGAGVLGLAAGTVFGLMAASRSSTQKTDCRVKTDCVDYWGAVAAHDDAVTFGTISTVAFAAGGGALAIGTILLLTAPTSKPAVGSGPLRLAPSASPRTVGLTLSGAFE